MIKKTRVVDPSGNVISDAELKSWTFVEHTDDDTLISGLIASATDMFERYTGLYLLEQEWDFFFDCAPAGELEIMAFDVTAVTQIIYTLSDDSSVLLNSAPAIDGVFYYDIRRNPFVICPVNGWPDIKRVGYNNLTIRLKMGYADTANIPEGIKTCLKLLAAELYRNREASAPVKLEEIPMGIKFHMDPFRVLTL